MQTLTPRQLTMLQLIIDGKIYAEVAHVLGKTTEAVNIEMLRARRRVGVVSMYRLVAVSIALGWCSIDFPPPISELSEPGPVISPGSN